MPLRGPYAPERPELDPFLFAAVGKEVDGIPLSVLSALSRLGLDPRGEAARLCHLTGGAAADQLAETIAHLPGERWTPPEMRSIAARLVELLPGVATHENDRDVTCKAMRKNGPWPSLSLILLALVGAVLIGFWVEDCFSSERQEPSQLTSPADH